MKKRPAAFFLAAALLVSLCLAGCRPKDPPPPPDAGSALVPGGEPAPALPDPDPAPEDGTQPGGGPLSPAEVPAPVETAPTAPEAGVPAGDGPENPPPEELPREAPLPEDPPVQTPPEEPVPAEIPPAVIPPAEEPPMEEPPAEESPAQEPPSVPDIVPGAAREVELAALAFFTLTMQDDPAALRAMLDCPEGEALPSIPELEDLLAYSPMEGIAAHYHFPSLSADGETTRQLTAAALAMLRRTQLTVQVLALDEAVGSACVTCTVTTFEPGFLEAAVARATLLLLMREEDFSQVLAAGDPAALSSRLLPEVVRLLDALQPTRQASFEADFILVQVPAGGQAGPLWRPADGSFPDCLLQAILTPPESTVFE